LVQDPLISKISYALSLALALGCADNAPDDAPSPTAGAGGTNATGGGAGGGSAGVVTAGSGADAGSSAGGAGAGTGGNAPLGGGGAGGAGAASGGSGGASAGTAGSGGTASCTVPATPAAQPMLLSQTGCVDPTDPKKAAAALLPYEVNSPLWSDNAAKQRFIKLPAGTKIHVKNCATEPETCEPPESGGSAEEEGHWALPVGTVLMKTFAIGGKLIETRLLMHTNGTTWRGYSYEWNDSETEATLLSDSKDKDLGEQVWHYPSPSECLQCHTKEGGRSLGPTTAQMNREFAYADGAMNQIAKFDALGLFDVTPVMMPAYPDPSGSADVTSRARSYMHTNCSICHRAGGTLSDVDLRYTVAFEDTNLCNQPIIRGTGDAALPQIRLVPGSPEQSNLSFRMHDTTNYRMPKIGSTVVDTAGTALIDEWISAMTSCPP
jgi:uncharacterized repeat protein (TIGR03806 family)